MDTLRTKPCPTCTKTAELKYKDHIGYQDSQRYDIYHCNHCYSAFVSPLKVDHKIYNLIYSQIEKVPGYSRYCHYANQILNESEPLQYLADSEDMYWAIQEYLKKHTNKTLKILEVGCGFGYLTYSLKKAGYDILGIDISQVAVENAQKKYGNHFLCVDINDYAKQSGAQYDVVIFTEVIEHIEDIKGFLTSANALLRSGGDLVVTTPNRTSYPVDVLWDTEPPPIHLWWFSEQSMGHLASQLGNKVSFVDFTNFNVLELDRLQVHQGPYIAIRNWQPSRYPRLNQAGQPLNLGDLIPPPIPDNLVRARNAFKRFLSKIGFLRGMLLIKNISTGWKKKRRIRRIREHLLKNGQRRSTLCAIFHKP